jgi:ABC-type antimicrobial peptide transport system permease subunit
VLISLAVGVGLTVAGALYPAWQAARMQPIEAMRVET